MSTNYHILPPVYTLIKLALLSFYPENTKLCIGNSTGIEFREPAYLQSIVRWTMGETRSDIYSLHKPFIVAIKFLESSNVLALRKILNYVHQGLIKLQKCYKTDPKISKCLQKMLKIVDSYLMQRQTKSALSHSYFITENEECYPMYINATFLHDLWGSQEIVAIVGILDSIKKTVVFGDALCDPLRQQIIGAMDLILERKFLRYLKKNSIESGNTKSF